MNMPWQAPYGTRSQTVQAVQTALQCTVQAVLQCTCSTAPIYMQVHDAPETMRGRRTNCCKACADSPHSDSETAPLSSHRAASSKQPAEAATQHYCAVTAALSAACRQPPISMCRSFIPSITPALHNPLTHSHAQPLRLSLTITQALTRSTTQALSHTTTQSLTHSVIGQPLAQSSLFSPCHSLIQSLKPPLLSRAAACRGPQQPLARPTSASH